MRKHLTGWRFQSFLRWCPTWNRPNFSATLCLQAPVKDSDIFLEPLWSEIHFYMICDTNRLTDRLKRKRRSRSMIEPRRRGNTFTFFKTWFFHPLLCGLSKVPAERSRKLKVLGHTLEAGSRW